MQELFSFFSVEWHKEALFHSEYRTDCVLEGLFSKRDFWFGTQLSSFRNFLLCLEASSWLGISTIRAFQNTQSSDFFFFGGGLVPIIKIKPILLIASGVLLLMARIYFLFFILSSAPKLCLFVSGTWAKIFKFEKYKERKDTNREGT